MVNRCLVFYLFAQEHRDKFVKEQAQAKIDGNGNTKTPKEGRWRD